MSKRYLVTGLVTISVSIEVEAKSKAEARRVAADASMMTLCNSCSSGSEGEWSTSGELDGVPVIETIEEQP